MANNRIDSAWKFRCALLPAGDAELLYVLRKCGGGSDE